MRLPLAAVALLSAPAVAAAADQAVPGAGTGVWALVGAFLGQLASSIVVKRELRAHEVRCRAYAPPADLLGSKD